MGLHSDSIGEGILSDGVDSLISEKMTIVSDVYVNETFIDSKYECTNICCEVEIILSSEVIVLKSNRVDE